MTLYWYKDDTDLLCFHFCRPDYLLHKLNTCIYSQEWKGHGCEFQLLEWGWNECIGASCLFFTYLAQAPDDLLSNKIIIQGKHNVKFSSACVLLLSSFSTTVELVTKNRPFFIHKHYKLYNYFYLYHCFHCSTLCHHHHYTQFCATVFYSKLSHWQHLSVAFSTFLYY